jgi:hypothetical protein
MVGRSVRILNYSNVVAIGLNRNSNCNRIGDRILRSSIEVTKSELGLKEMHREHVFYVRAVIADSIQNPKPVPSTYAGQALSEAKDQKSKIGLSGTYLYGDFKG